MSKTIMIVDDNVDLRFSVMEGLKDLGVKYTFTEAEDGKQCMALLKKGPLPDLILLDIMMPKMDGWQVAAAVNKDSKLKKVPIIFLTAKTDEFIRGIGSITAVEYITKPFKITMLRDKIDHALK